MERRSRFGILAFTMLVLVAASAAGPKVVMEKPPRPVLPDPGAKACVGRPDLPGCARCLRDPKLCPDPPLQPPPPPKPPGEPKNCWIEPWYCGKPEPDPTLKPSDTRPR